jgi:Flp pilus assembly protein TadG
MISFLKKVWRDRRGNALVIAGAALPLVIGSAGLATDTIQWSLWKRQLQRAADSAALAGAYAEATGNAVDTGNCLTSTANSAHPIRFDLSKNDHSGITTSCTASNPPATGSYTTDSTAVHVALSGSRALSFSGMFMTSAPTLTASATAKLIDDGNFCLVTLKRDSGAGISMGGSSTANLGCGAISNSTGSSSITSNGNAYTFTADPVASVGGMPQSINGSTNLEPYHLPQSDPFSGKYPTDIPSGTTCKTFAQNGYTPTTGSGKNTVTVNHL